MNYLKVSADLAAGLDVFIEQIKRRALGLNEYSSIRKSKQINIIIAELSLFLVLKDTTLIDPPEHLVPTP
jgi:hypothetical protein